MTNREKFFLYGLGSIIVILLVVWGISSIKLNKLKKERDIQAVELMTFKDSVTMLKTKHGELYAEIANVNIEKNTLKSSLDKLGLERDKLKAMGIKWRDLSAYFKAKFESSGSGVTLVHDTVYVDGKDTIHGKKFDDWTDGYLFLTKMVSDNKKLTFDHKYEGVINHAETKIGKETKVTIWLSDPKATILTGSQITIINKKKWYEKPWIWGVAGTVGGYYLSKKL